MAAERADDPRAALQRIEALCAAHPTLFGAMLAVVASHPGVPRPLLATAIKQFRRDADTLTLDDMVGLQVSISNGAQQAFDAVLRTRRGGERKAAALPFIRPD
jgi:DNA-binding transcriptional LysR family regulator